VAIVKKGSMLEGLRGRVGDLVFREVGGQTVVSRRPSGRNEDVRSPQRERALTRFQQAVLFAREARHRHSYRSLSRVLRAHSPYHVALQDYLSDPVIERIDDSSVGPSGGELVIAVSERIAVRGVRIKMAGLPVKGVPSLESETRTAEATPGAPGAGVSTPGGTAPAGPTPSADRGARYPIPAAVFFRRLTRPEKPEKQERPEKQEKPEKPELPRQINLTIHPIDQALTAAPHAAAQGEAEVVDTAGPVEIHATRHMGIRQRSADGPDRRVGKDAHTEIWRVTLPRPGEVEVIATDYAGNRAVRVFKAGLPATDPE
jgi:hypothetical protein